MKSVVYTGGCQECVLCASLECGLYLQVFLYRLKEWLSGTVSRGERVISCQGSAVNVDLLQLPVVAEKYV